VLEVYTESLDLSKLGFKTAEAHKTGRPMYNPQDMLKLYMWGYMNRIRSSRRLETETKRNLEVLWLMRRLSPDHKTIARFRQENPMALKNVFCDFVTLCVRLGLYGKELAAIDGSKFKAVNSRARNFTKTQVQDKIARLTAKIEEYIQEMESADAEENDCEGEKSKEEISQIIQELSKHKERYQGYAQELEQNGEKQKSLTDADSRLMQTNGKMDVCYNVQTSVDAKNKLIAEFEISNQGNDKNFITPLAKKTKAILETETIIVAVDNGYESIQDILAAKSQGIEAHVAGTDFDVCVPSEGGQQIQIRSHHNGRCVYIKERNISLCPMGNVLYPQYYNNKKTRGAGIFQNIGACRKCTCKCTKDKRNRFRHLVEMPKKDFSKEYNDEGLAIKQIRIAPKKEIMVQRKSLVEHPFGTIKRNMDGGYCLTKGLEKVSGEFSLMFLAYNIKRVINILGSRKLIESLI